MLGDKYAVYILNKNKDEYTLVGYWNGNDLYKIILKEVEEEGKRRGIPLNTPMGLFRATCFYLENGYISDKETERYVILASKENPFEKPKEEEIIAAYKVEKKTCEEKFNKY